MTVANGHVKRSSGELADAIHNSLMPRVPKVSEPLVRQVLTAMAYYTNPNRDQFLGLERTWMCFASVATLAEHIGCSVRQVVRALKALKDHAYIDEDRPASGPGRPREGQSATHGRPTRWCLRPDLWPPRPTRKTQDTGVTSLAAGGKTQDMVSETQDMGVTSFQETQDTGDRIRQETQDTGVTLTPETFNPKTTFNPGDQPPRGRAREEISKTIPVDMLFDLAAHFPACGAQQEWPPGLRCKNPGWHASVAVTA